MWPYELPQGRRWQGREGVEPCRHRQAVEQAERAGAAVGLADARDARQVEVREVREARHGKSDLGEPH